MKIIVGLGNPGKEFKNTKHNVGFMVIEKFARLFNFPPFKLEKKSQCLITKKDDIILIKPYSFMNNSGIALKKFLQTFKSSLPPQSLVIVHDDIDILLGRIKIAYKRGAAGHKGVESIINNVTDDLIRFRIGIKSSPSYKAKEIVLQKFNPDEKKLFKKALEKTVKALHFFVKNDLEKTMNEYNRGN